MDILWAISEIRTDLLTAVFRVIQLLGETSFLLVIMCLIYWTVDKDLAYRVGFAFFISGIGVQAAKVIFRVPRPWVRDPSFEPVESALETATGYSFPSGHTQSAVALFGTIGLALKKKWISAMLYVLMTLLAFSRMYMGVHYLSDVLAAYVFTMLIVLIVNRAPMEKNRRSDAIRSAVMIAAAVAGTVYTYIMYTTGKVGVVYADDMCKMAGAATGFAVSYFVERHYVDFSVKCDALWKHAVKLISGLAVVLGLQSGLKAVLGTAPVAHFFRYGIMLTWAMLIYPMILKGIQSRRKSA